MSFIVAADTIAGISIPLATLIVVVAALIVSVVSGRNTSTTDRVREASDRLLDVKADLAKSDADLAACVARRQELHDQVFELALELHALRRAHERCPERT